ncbi:N-formylglutamate deformylase [Jannaschia seosinensis]|uniref:N-formylglutamate deformylase n=1 Tax=Jannaschia seosinensis TaxID=313367 RepID=A0A0M7B5N1_9RHOB|nr:N-formylglutamate amidohydrolase [Jannaschia seosinensis]CUH15834.1 N-formylglutamate deformylase [Jannaschia seosinensis]
MTAPFHIINSDGAAPWVLACDHATNRVPPDVAEGDLGLPPADMSRHIAFDIGAAGVTRELSRLLGAPAILSDFSRLVIDPNRGEDDPTLLMKLYDGTIIPGNRHADAEERARRVALFHRPYHEALAGLLEARGAASVTCGIHSFTPQLRGRPPRPWQIGVLFEEDRRLSDPFVARLRAEPDLCIGLNEPYPGGYPGDTMDRHARARGRPSLLIEIRNDLISDEVGQAYWAARLAPLMQAALEDANHAQPA